MRTVSVIAGINSICDENLYSFLVLAGQFYNVLTKSLMEKLIESFH